MVHSPDIYVIQFLTMHSARNYDPQPAIMRPSASVVRYHWSPDSQAEVVQPYDCRRKMANIDLAQNDCADSRHYPARRRLPGQYGTTLTGQEQTAGEV
jgi:hypothetical protein